MLLPTVHGGVGVGSGAMTDMPIVGTSSFTLNGDDWTATGSTRDFSGNCTFEDGVGKSRIPGIDLHSFVFHAILTTPAFPFLSLPHISKYEYVASMHRRTICIYFKKTFLMTLLQCRLPRIKHPCYSSCLPREPGSMLPTLRRVRNLCCSSLESRRLYFQKHSRHAAQAAQPEWEHCVQHRDDRLCTVESASNRPWRPCHRP